VQTAGVAATVQTAGVAATVHTAKLKVAGVSATTKINKSLVVLASGVKLHGGLVR
jgi:hypothetical protein